jgi:hypothetical protein
MLFLLIFFIFAQFPLLYISNFSYIVRKYKVKYSQIFREILPAESPVAIA